MIVMEQKDYFSSCHSEREDIDYVFMFEGYTIMVMKNGSNEIVDLPISKIEKKLNDRYFFRIHRSYLVNLRRIRELEINDKQLLIRMRGHHLPVARRRKKQLLDLLGAVN
jgi:two-component system, LytTR family, response regulator